MRHSDFLRVLKMARAPVACGIILLSMFLAIASLIVNSLALVWWTSDAFSASTSTYVRTWLSRRL